MVQVTRALDCAALMGDMPPTMLHHIATNLSA